MINIKNLFKKLTILGWITTVLFLAGGLIALIGLILVLASGIPEAGLVILVIGFCMLLLTIPFIFACSLENSLRRIAEEDQPQAEPTIEPTPMPAPQPASIPMPAPEIPLTPPQPTAAPQATVPITAIKTPPPITPPPIPSVPEATVAIPAVKPQPASKPSYIYLLDELNMKNQTSLTKADLKDARGMTLVFARDKEGYAIQMVRALAGNIETERFFLSADYFQTNSKNDFRIWLFKQSIFRVDVDLLWEDPEFRAIIGIEQ